MAFPRALLSAAAAIGDGAEVYGGIRNAGDAAAGHHAGVGGRTVAGGSGPALFRALMRVAEEGATGQIAAESRTAAGRILLHGIDRRNTEAEAGLADPAGHPVLPPAGGGIADHDVRSPAAVGFHHVLERGPPV